MAQHLGKVYLTIGYSMLRLSNQVIQEVFPESINRLRRWIIDQRRILRYWLITFTIIALYFFLDNIESTVPYLIKNQQQVMNAILILWLLVITFLPFIWLQQPGDIFSENFKKRLGSPYMGIFR